jgi:hypothetical protein
MRKQRTLITKRLYFGIEAQRLRDASGRVLSRVVGLTPERARVSAAHVQHDFGMDTVEGRALVDEFVAEGLLRPRSDRQGDYFLTERFVEVASARVVEPLPRAKAKLLVARATDLAAELNADAPTNPLEIEAVATYGSYMSLDDEMGDLDFAVIVHMRPRPRRLLTLRRMAPKAEGAEQIRTAFRALSSFVNVQLLTELRLVPRPFAVIYQQR